MQASARLSNASQLKDLDESLNLILHKKKN